MYENISSANRWYFNITELMFLVRLEGFEPPVFKFVAWYSIQLNYRRIFCEFYCFFYFCLFLFASFTCSIILWFFFLFKSFLEFFEFFFKISCQIVFFVVYYISVQVISRCSAVGSARGLGPWGNSIKLQKSEKVLIKEIWLILFFYVVLKNSIKSFKIVLKSMF